MINSFRHKGLEKFYQTGSKKGIFVAHTKRLRLILGLLDSAFELGDLALPGLKLHPLKGDLKGYWSVEVSGNWRLVFRFSGHDVYDINYLDYH